MKALILFTLVFSIYSAVDAKVSGSGNLRCIGKRCTYRLINPAVFSASQLITAAGQALTGVQYNRISQKDVWIGPGSGKFSNLEIAFYAKDQSLIDELKAIIVQLDRDYNKVDLTPILVTAQIYAVEESALKDIGIGIDGFWGGDNLSSSTSSNAFSPVTGIATGLFGSASNLLRIQLNFAVENGKAMSIEDRSVLEYHGARVSFSDSQAYYRDGTVSTAEGELGFKFSADIYVDDLDPSKVNVSDIELKIGFAPTADQVGLIASKSPYGARTYTSNSEYRLLTSGLPTVLADTIVYANYDEDSWGLFTGVNRGGKASRIIVVLTAEVNPEPVIVPKISQYTPEKLRKMLDYSDGEGWEAENEKKKKSNSYNWSNDSDECDHAMLCNDY